MEKLKTRLPDLFHAAAPGLPASDDGTSAEWWKFFWLAHKLEFYARVSWVGNFVYSRITLVNLGQNSLQA
jgi:hypothetical protein